MRSLKRLIYAGDSIWRFISHDFWIPCSSNHTCPFPLWLIPLRTAMSCALFSQSRLRLLKMGLFWWMLRYVGNTDVRPGASRRHVRHGCRLPHVSNRILIRDHRMTWSKRFVSVQTLSAPDKVRRAAPGRYVPAQYWNVCVSVVW